MSVTAVVPCTVCDLPQGVEMSEDQYARIINWRATSEHVQDILPNHSASDRELFISGICRMCWSEIFEE